MPDFGTDGPGPNDGYSQELSFELSGDQIPTNLRVTALDNTPLENLNAAARAIVLVQVNDTTIEGRIVGDGNPGTADQYVAFRITLNNANDPATATITVDQFLPIDHGADQVSAFDEVTTLLTSGDGTLVLHQVTTITDGDTDTIVQDDTVNLLANENSFISFDDDGPLVSVQANAAFSINHDETLLLQAPNDILFTSVFNGVANPGDDQNVPLSLPLGYARSTNAALSDQADDVTGPVAVFTNANIANVGIDPDAPVAGQPLAYAIENNNPLIFVPLFGVDGRRNRRRRRSHTRWC